MAPPRCTALLLLASLLLFFLCISATHEAARTASGQPIQEQEQEQHGKVCGSRPMSPSSFVRTNRPPHRFMKSWRSRCHRELIEFYGDLGFQLLFVYICVLCVGGGGDDGGELRGGGRAVWRGRRRGGVLDEEDAGGAHRLHLHPGKSQLIVSTIYYYMVA